MAVTDPDSVRQIRLLTADLDTTSPLVTDEQLQDLLDLNSGNVKRAAADALEAVAVSEVLVSKKIRTQDLSTDGPAVAKALLELARSLRERADAEDPEAGAFDGFDLAPVVRGSRRPELTEPHADTVWGL